MREYRDVTYHQLKKGQEISGVRTGRGREGFTGYVKDINVAYVTIERWRKGGEETKYNSEECLFSVEMTDEELRKKYNTDAGELVKAIQNDIVQNIGYKEMYNAWLSSDPWEMAQMCRSNKIKVLGHTNDIVPKQSLLADVILDVGVIAEDEYGNRFWCHSQSRIIDLLVRKYKRYQEYIKNGETEDIELVFADAEWNYDEEKEHKNAD